MRTLLQPQSGPAGTAPPAGPPRLRRRRIILIAVAALAVIASVGGLLVSTSIKSPAQLAAQTAAPAMTQLTVPLTRQVIKSTVLAQGLVKRPAEGGPAVRGQFRRARGSGSDGELPIVTKIF